MKKFLLSLFILAVFAGAVFFLGWVQFSVPAGHVGILVSKTGGINPEPVVPGQFRWTWEKLLPTNCEILIFRPVPQECTFSRSGTLPSAELYSRFLDGNPDFSWKLSASLSVAAAEDALPDLVRRFGLRSDEDLRALLDSEAEKAFQTAAEKYLEAAAQQAFSGEDSPLSVSVFSGVPVFAVFAGDALPEGFSLAAANVTDSHLPDFRLYARGAEVYGEYAAEYGRMAAAVALQSAESEISSREQMRLFAEWGTFLQKFPSLIEFLAVARDDAAGTLDLLRELRSAAAEPAAAPAPENAVN